MGGFFRAVKKIFMPKIPKAPAYKAPVAPPPPPPVPVEAAPDTQKSIDEAKAADDEKRRQQKGRAATILGGKTSGILGDDMGIATKKLLGK